jgi:predicted DNA-binding transcriptional regulator YafY
VTVRISVDAAQRDAMLAQLGADATIVDDDHDETLIELTVTNRSAFRAFLLGFLEHARVVEPPDVRDEMVVWLSRIAATAS